MRVICICNQKGGVGKTATASNLGAALSMLGSKVLVCDMDPQFDCTKSFGIKLAQDDASMFDFLMGAVTIEDVVERVAENLDFIPCTPSLGLAEQRLINEAGREFFLRDHFENMGDRYDYVLLDCPPALNVLTVNAISAATDILITIETEYLAMTGVKEIRKTIASLQKRLRLSCQIMGALPTKYDSRKRLHKQSLEMIREAFPDVVFKTVIRTNSPIAEASSAGKSIFDYAPKSTGAEDYFALAKEVIERIPVKEVGNVR